MSGHEYYNIGYLFPMISWLYSLFLGLDANFRLKRKDVSSDKRDSSLSSGWSYFVPNAPYKEHLERYKGESKPVITELQLSLKQWVDFCFRKVTALIMMLWTCQAQNQTRITLPPELARLSARVIIWSIQTWWGIYKKGKGKTIWSHRFSDFIQRI